MWVCGHVEMWLKIADFIAATRQEVGECEK
jgi:hypothetical protein